MKSFILLISLLLPAHGQPGADINAILDGRDPVRAQMLKTIAAFEAHDAPAVVREADKMLKLDRTQRRLKPRELGLVYSMQGIAYLFQDRPKTALPILEKASSLTDDSRTFYNLACAQSVLGKFPKAESSFRKALEAGSKNDRFGSAAHWIAESKTDEQLAALRARPAYRKILREFE